jgi:hypothetical protein
MSEGSPFMQGNVIDGKAVAAQLRSEIAERVKELKEQHGKVGAVDARAGAQPGATHPIRHRISPVAPSRCPASPW